LNREVGVGRTKESFEKLRGSVIFGSKRPKVEQVRRGGRRKETGTAGRSERQKKGKNEESGFEKIMRPSKVTKKRRKKSRKKGMGRQNRGDKREKRIPKEKEKTELDSFN